MRAAAARAKKNKGQGASPAGVEEDSATGREGVLPMAEVAATAEATEAGSAVATEEDSAEASVEGPWLSTTRPLSNPRGRSTSPSRRLPEVEEEEGEDSRGPATGAAIWAISRMRAQPPRRGSEEPRFG